MTGPFSGFPSDDYARSDLLHHNKTVQARWPEPTPTTIHSADFIDRCAERLRTCPISTTGSSPTLA